MTDEDGEGEATTVGEPDDVTDADTDGVTDEVAEAVLLVEGASTRTHTLCAASHAKPSIQLPQASPA